MSLELLTWIFAFLFGSAIGSFLNVVIYRLPLGLSIVHPPSHCPHCKIPLRWYWNIPVFGWLALLGRCRNCGAPIAFRYPFVELLTGLLGLGIVYQYGVTPWAIFMFVFACALVVVAFIDIDHMIIPDSISLPGIPLGLIGQVLLPEGNPLQAVIAVLVGGGGLYLLAWVHHRVRGVEGMGGGDIKLLAMIGAFSEPLAILQTILVGSLLGSVIGIGYLALSKKGKETRIPFGPFLSLGALTWVLWPDVFAAVLTGDALLFP